MLFQHLKYLDNESVFVIHNSLKLFGKDDTKRTQLKNYGEVRRVPTQHLRRSRPIHRPRTRIARAEQLKELARILGYDPEKVLVKEALLEPHRVHISPAEREEADIQTLRKAVKELLRKELLDAKDNQTGINVAAQRPY